MTTNPPTTSVEEVFVDVEIGDSADAQAPPLRFAIARHPTTVEAYQRFIESGGYTDVRWWSNRGASWRDRHGIAQPTFWGRPGYDHPKLPVTGVSFWEAEAYARFRGAELPTEHEWYLVASNGGVTRYPWGNDHDGADTDRANLAFFGAFSRSERLPVDRSSRSASVHGVCDLIGNVGEWCLLGAGLFLTPRQKTAVLRGGSAWHVPGVADASFRDVVPLTVRDNQTGIRLVHRVAAPLTATSGNRAVAKGARSLGRSIKRPTTPFRQEGLPIDLTEASWRLTLRGHSLGQPQSFSLSELQNRFSHVTEDGLFVCVCRWGQQNSFTGVRLRDVLDACQVPWREQVLYLLQRSAPGRDSLVYETTVPIRQAVESQALLAWAMDGRPLTLDLGWPMRYMDWSLYGYKCVKCLTELVVTTALEPGWWERKCQYDVSGTIMPGTITVVGDEASRLDISGTGRVRNLPLYRHNSPAVGRRLEVEVSTIDSRPALAARAATPEPRRTSTNHTSIMDALAEDGIAKVGTVLSTEQIASILQWLDARETPGDELVKGLQPFFDVSPDGQRRLGKIRRLFWSDPRFWADVFVKSRILDSAVDLVGPGATLLFHTAFMKPGSFGSEVTLHQDQGVTPWDLPYVITMWIALTPSKVANGCVIGYPGSHRQGLIPHVLSDGTVLDRSNPKVTSWPSIPPSRFIHDTPVPYELEPGEAVAWHHFFVHGSRENRSAIDRRGIALVFADALRPGYRRPDLDYTGRPMEPLSVSDIRGLAAKS